MNGQVSRPAAAAAVANHPLDDLIDSADAARVADDVAGGLAVAEVAWAAVSRHDPKRRMRIGVLLAHFLYRSGALGPLVDCGLQVAPLVRSHGSRADLIDLLRMVSIGACERQRFETALNLAQEAHALALASQDRGRMSLTLNTLGCLFERLGDPWQAERLLMEALQQAQDEPEGHPMFTALNNLSACLIGKHYLMRDALAPDDAQAPLRTALPFAERAVAHRQSISQPFYRVFSLGNLGEILVLLGQADRAEAALCEALEIAQARGFDAQVERIRCSLAELMLLRGQVQQAQEELQQVMQGGDGLRQPVVTMRLHHARWRSARSLGLAQEALDHLQCYLKLERQRSINQLSGQSKLFVTRMEAEHSRHEARLHHARARELEADALRDQLTGLSNRRELDRRWPDLVAKADAGGSPFSVAMLDLDHFKQVNDRFGHAAGDRVLVALADLLRTHTRGSDLVARVGGEEFLLVLPDTTEQTAAEVCERLRHHVQIHPWSQIDEALRVTISCGLCSAPAVAFDSLRDSADQALYRAKREGRNRLVLYP
ncbi:MAG: diguanylate cyclase [Rubrivivax sp.]